MKALVYALRSFGRELRSGEVIVLLAAVALAVAALTAVGFLTDRIGRAVARQANEVLSRLEQKTVLKQSIQLDRRATLHDCRSRFAGKGDLTARRLDGKR